MSKTKKIIFDAKLKAEYQGLYDTMVINPDRVDDVQKVVARCLAGKARYLLVQAKCGVPWQVIAMIHSMEGGNRFTTHLHNGDPLTARTVKEPPGRPAQGQPPFKWEDSALDALTFKGFHKNRDWSIPGTLWFLENYNGLGYRKYHSWCLSPYLWSFSNHYAIGKYKSDGHFDPKLVSAQCGTALILKGLGMK